MFCLTCPYCKAGWPGFDSHKSFFVCACGAVCNFDGENWSWRSVSESRKLEVMKCRNCKEGRPCPPPPHGIHLHLTHLISLDPVLCQCGAKGRVCINGSVVFKRDADGQWVEPTEKDDWSVKEARA